MAEILPPMWGFQSIFRRWSECGCSGPLWKTL